MARIFEACASRDQAIILTASDHHHCDVAGAILLWDENSLYYWLSTRDDSRPNNNANSVLILEAVEYARKMQVTFDMDGYRKPCSGFFLSKFGLAPERRIVVRRTQPFMRYLVNRVVSPDQIAALSPLPI